MMRIGFVGTGLIAWCHGLGLKAMIDAGVIDATIVAVHDPRQKQAQAFADALGSDGVVVAADAAEVAEGSDLVWVCTPTSAHRAAIDAALQAGRAVFCEKPLDRDLASAVALADAVAASGVPSQCGLVLRSAPVFRCVARPRTGRLAGGADGGHLSRRPVLPDPGPLRLAVARRRGPGRRWVPD